MSDLSRRDAAKRIARFGAVLAAGGLAAPRAAAIFVRGAPSEARARAELLRAHATAVRAGQVLTQRGDVGRGPVR